MSRLQCAMAAFAVGLSTVLSQPAQGAFLTDSKAALTLRNFYMDRDFKSEPTRYQPQSRQAEWAQSVILNLQSGYTEGWLGFAAGLTGMTGIKLDSSPERSGTGLLLVDSDGRAKSSYSKLGVVLKARASKSELAVGSLTPMVPVLVSPSIRLFPPMFRGAQLTSGEVRNLTLRAGYLDRIMQRNSRDFEPITLANPWGRFSASAEGDYFAFAGGDYRWTPKLATSYYYSTLHDVYQQHFLGLQFSHRLGAGSMDYDLRYFSSREEGAALAGNIDNQYAGIQASYEYRQHAFTAGYYRLFGENGFPGLGGTVTYLHSQGLLVSDMGNRGERVWQVRYDYDFAGLGLPGLLATVRYASGSHIDLPAFNSGRSRESERYLELSYVIQQGPLKDMAFRVRQSDYRSDYCRDINELRINAEYTLKLW